MITGYETKEIKVEEKESEYRIGIRFKKINGKRFALASGAELFDIGTGKPIANLVNFQIDCDLNNLVTVHAKFYAASVEVAG